MERLYNSLLIYDKTQLFMYHVGKYTIPTGSYMGIVKLRQTGRMVLLTMPSTSVLVHLGQVKQWWSSLRAVFKKSWGTSWFFWGHKNLQAVFKSLTYPKLQDFVVAVVFCCGFFGSPLSLNADVYEEMNQPRKDIRKGNRLVRVCQVHVPQYAAYIWAVKKDL